MKRLLTVVCVLLILGAVIACFQQFRISHGGPLAAAMLFLAPVVYLRPSFRWFCMGLLFATTGLLAADAFLNRHQLAIELRTWSVFSSQLIEDTLPSPSGRSTAYIVGDHWLDSFYQVYISDGHLFPKHAYLPASSTDPVYPRDMIVAWSNDVLTVTVTSPVLRYSESTGLLEILSH